ncbi:hypothetical protein Alsa1_CDS0245 [Staphylococcus phage Alsa_1]|nr:hypothetical protein Alsa1_CDS0245 [Staphylococcus phage Alsa_1]
MKRILIDVQINLNRLLQLTQQQSFIKHEITN